MIKKLFILCFLYCCLPLAKGKAQSSPYSEKLGVVDTEITYKECSFDKEATAVVFVDEAVSEYDDSYKLMTFHHVKLKILKDKGIDYGTVAIPFYSQDDFESIYDVQGVVYNYNDGALSSKKIDRKSVYTQKENKYWSEIKFAFPELKTGSIIEYIYTSSKKHYGGLKEWVFQEDIPVLKSNYVLSIIPNAEFSYAVQKSPDLHIDIKPDNSQGKITFEMDNIPGLRDERYIDSKNDYLQKVSFQISKYKELNIMTNWTQVNNEMFTENSFYGQLKKNVAGTEGFLKDVAQDTSSIGKMKKVYSYVRDNMTWNNINSKYSDGIKQAWDKKTGTSGDMNLLLINLLRQAGLDANPVMVSERYNGRVDTKSTMVDQFNTVYACVTIQNKRYYLDATDKYGSCLLTPYVILNTTGFIVNHKRGELVDIVDSAALYKENIYLSASVDADGILSGTFNAQSFDYARGYRLKNFKNNSTVENEKLFSGNLTGLNFSDFRTENAESDSDSYPLTSKAKFTLPLNSSKDYYFLPANLLAGLNENPFINENRFSNINFGYKQFIQFTFYVRVDKSFAIDDVPKSIRLKDAEGDIAFSRMVFADKDQNDMRITSTLEINRNLYPVSQYDVIRDFYKRLFDLLNEKIVLKKNN